MLGCLWGRARLSKEYSSLFYDTKAVELVKRIDFDFSASDVPPFVGIMHNTIRTVNRPEFRLGTLRAKQFDEKAKRTSQNTPMHPFIQRADPHLSEHE